MNLVEISVRISSPAANSIDEVEVLEADVLVDERAQADVHPLVLGVVAGDVLEGVEVEVAAELAVEHLEDVLVEFGGDAGRRRRRRPPGGPSSLTRSVPSSRWSPGSSRAGDPGQEGGAARRGRGCRPCRRGRRSAAGRPRSSGMRSRWCSKSQTRPWTSRPGYSSTSARGGLVGDLLGDVDRDVGVRGCRRRASRSAGGGSSRPSRSRARSGSPGRPAAATISAERLDEDLPLGAGRVVLLQLGDRARRAASRARRRSTSARAPSASAARPARTSRAIVAAASASRWTSIAIITSVPRAAQAGEDLAAAAAGPSCGSWAGRRRGWVAQEAPRSTLCSAPKKTSEYSG